MSAIGLALSAISRGAQQLLEGDALMRVVAAAKLAQPVVAEVPDAVQLHARKRSHPSSGGRIEKACGRHRKRIHAPPDAWPILTLHLEGAHQNATLCVLDEVVVLDVAMELIVLADTKAELLVSWIELALAPEEEVRGLVLDITAGRAPGEKREEVREDRSRIPVPGAVDGAPRVAALELDLAADCSCDTPLVTAEGALDDLRGIATEPHLKIMHVVEAPRYRRTPLIAHIVDTPVVLTKDALLHTFHAPRDLG